MSLHRYFQRAQGLPSPKGPLSATVSPAAIKATNQEVSKQLQSIPSHGQSRGTYMYSKISSEQQAQIANYASLHGNTQAICRFSKELGIDVKESSVQVWKTKYLAEISQRREKGESGDISITSVPSKKWGWPLLLGESWIWRRSATFERYGLHSSVREEKGKFNSQDDSWELSSYKSTVPAWHHSHCWDERDPPSLVFNRNKTGISIVPGSSWTMELKGSKRVEESAISSESLQFSVAPWPESSCHCSWSTKGRLQPASQKLNFLVAGMWPVHPIAG